MHTILWIVQIALGVMFLAAGALKLTTPKEKVHERLAWVEDFTQGQLRTIGLLEVLGALGLVLPMALGVLPILTPLAALGLTLTMIGAAYTHYRRREYPLIAVNGVLLVMAAFVVYGRLVALPVV